MSVVRYSGAGATADGTALIAYPNQPTKIRENGVWSLQYKYWCLTSVALDTGVLPAEGASKSYDSVTYYCTRVEVQAHEAPEISDVVVTYSKSTSNRNPYQKDGDTEKRVRTCQRAVPVDDASLIATYPSEAAAAALANQATVQVGGLEYEYSTYLDSFTWSEANISAPLGIGIGQANKVGSQPTGITSPTSKKWKFGGMDVSTQGSITRKTERWEYSPLDWPV